MRIARWLECIPSKAEVMDSIPSTTQNQVRWCRAAVPPFQRWVQKNQEFKVTLDHTANSRLYWDVGDLGEDRRREVGRRGQRRQEVGREEKGDQT